MIRIALSLLVLGTLSLATWGQTASNAQRASSTFNVYPPASCDGFYHWVNVPDTKSLDGTETGFEYICLNGSAKGPLLIYFEGGGACWNGDTCDCQPDAYGNCLGPNATVARDHFDAVESFTGQRWGQEQTADQVMPLFGQTAAFAGPSSPFTGGVGTPFNFVVIPYTTGDLFMGSAVRNYKTSDGRPITAYHVGYENVTHDLLKIRQLFPDPSRIVVWGDSAGAAGADCNLLKFRIAWLFVSMWEMNNSLPAFDAANLMPLFPATARTWGTWEPDADGNVVEGTCPLYPVAGSTQWSLEWVKHFNAAVLSSVRKAFTDDYSDQAVQFFACLWGATVDPDGSCTSAVTSTLKHEFADVISTASNYKIFYHTGICHAEREADGNSVANGSDPSCDFDNMQQAGVYFHNWVKSWIENEPTWTNAQ